MNAFNTSPSGFEDEVGRYAREFFEAEYSARKLLNDQADMALRAYNFLDVEGDGSKEVERDGSMHGVKDGSTRSVVNSFADLLQAYIAPDMNYLSVKLSQKSAQYFDSDKIHDVLWEIIHRKNNFSDRVWSIMRDASLSFGVLAKVMWTEERDSILDQQTGFPSFHVYEFDDFVIESAAERPEDAAKCVRWAESEAAFKRNSLYDPAVVKEIVEDGNSDTSSSGVYYSSSSGTYIALTGAAQKGVTQKTHRRYYEIHEFVGDIYLSDGKILENYLITSCKDKILRCIPNPTPGGIDPFVYIRLQPTSPNTFLGMSLGHDIARYEARLNKLLTYADVMTCYNAAPSIAVDEMTWAAYGPKSGNSASLLRLRPFGTVPYKLGASGMPIQPILLRNDNKSAYDEINYLRSRMEMFSGVSTPTQGGQLQGNPTATEVNAITQGANTRINAYVKRMQSCISELFRKIASVWKFEIINEFVVDNNDENLVKILKDGVSIPVEAALDLGMDINVDGLTEIRISHARSQEFQQQIQFALSYPPFQQMVDNAKLWDEFWAKSPGGRSFADRIRVQQPDMGMDMSADMGASQMGEIPQPMPAQPGIAQLAGTEPYGLEM